MARPAARNGGQALVEFALIVPLLLLLLMGVLDFGRAIYAYNAISNAAREGGRTAIVNQTPAAVRTRAADQATALGIDAASTSCPPSGATGICLEFRNAALTAACAPVSGNYGCVAVVTVKYTFAPLTPIIGQIIGPIALTSTTKQPIESICIDAGTPTCPVP